MKQTEQQAIEYKPYFEGLNQRQIAWILNYYTPTSETFGKAAKSAKKANYSDSQATQACVRLVDNVKLKQAASHYLAEIKEKAVATRLQRQKFWTETMLADKVSMGDRLRASELLGKSEADFVDKIQHSGDFSLNLGVVKQYKQVESEVLEADNG